MRQRKKGPILWDGKNEYFKIWLYEDELVKYKEIWDKYPHDPTVRHLGCTDTREISIECLDAHITQYFMLMQQAVVRRIRAIVRDKAYVVRSDIKEMVVKFERDYSKSHEYEYLGIMFPERVNGVVHQICDEWLKKKTNIKVIDD